LNKVALVARMTDESFVTPQTAGKESVSWTWAQVYMLTIVALSFARGLVFIIPQKWSFALKPQIVQNVLC
jgi:hypothetical protein